MRLISESKMQLNTSSRSCNNRNIGIELFRCFLMFVICLRHATALSGYGLWWEANIFNFGVAGFALITGYFGVSFKPSRIIKLWGLAAICALIPAIGIALKWPSIGFAHAYKDCVQTNWYLNAYTVLLLLSPFLNDGLKSLSRGHLCGGLLLLLWLWASGLPGAKMLMPRLPGLNNTSAFTLICAYVIGYCLRQYKVFADWRRSSRILMASLMVPMMALMGANTSPFTIIFAAILLVEFSKVEVPKWGAVIRYISPSMFSVYLMHTNIGGLTLLENMISKGINSGLSRWCSFLLSSCCIFFVCCAIDLFRRSLYLSLIKDRVDSSLRLLDRKMLGVV